MTSLSSLQTHQPLEEAPHQAQLPFWPQQTRGLSNVLARSALFNVANARKGERRNLKREIIASLKGTTIRYTGEELRQCDEDVFLQVLHTARVQPLGSYVSFTGYQMLKELGWIASGKAYKRLIDALERMQASSVSVTVELAGFHRVNFTGSLIRKFRWREDTSGKPLRQWEVMLEPEIIALFGHDAFTRLNWEQRLSLSPMAKWLLTFYSTHDHPYPFKVETLHKLMGSDMALLRQYRYKLKQTLDVLVTRGLLAKAVVDTRTDLVHVEHSDGSRKRSMA